MNQISILLLCLFSAVFAQNFNIQTFNGYLSGLWSYKKCSDYYSVSESSAVIVESYPSQSYLLMFFVDYTDLAFLNCSYTEVDPFSVYVDKDLTIDYDRVTNTSGLEGQFLNLECNNATLDMNQSSVTTSVRLLEEQGWLDKAEKAYSWAESLLNWDDSSIVGKTTTTVSYLNMSLINVQAGVFLNFQNDTTCSVSFGNPNDSVSDIQSQNLKANSWCNCSTFCMNGDIMYEDYSETNTNKYYGESFYGFSLVNGSYVIFDRDSDADIGSLSDATIGCDLVYVPEYPTSMATVTDCYYERQSVIDNTLTTTVLGNGNLIIGDLEDEQCFQVFIVVKGQARIVASLLALFLVGLASLMA